MIKKIVYSLMALGLVFVFSGCSSKNITLKETPKMDNEELGYVIFNSSAYSNVNIMEFNEKLQPKLLCNLNSEEKFVHNVSPGKHYYLISPPSKTFKSKLITDDRIVIVDVKKGEIKYVSSFGEVLDNDKPKLIKKIQYSLCDTNFIKKYSFEVNDNILEDEDDTFYKKGNKYYNSDIYSLSMICVGNKITEIKDSSLESIGTFSESLFVKTPDSILSKVPIEKYNKSIKNLYPTFVIKHQNAFQHTEVNSYLAYLSGSSKVQIVKYTDNTDNKKYTGATLNAKINKELTKKQANSLKEKILKELNNHNIQHSNNLIIEYNIKNYVEGSQPLRYTGFTEEQRLNGATSFQVNVKYIDKKLNKLLNEFNFTYVITSGSFGGSNESFNLLAKAIAIYAKSEFF